MCSALVGIGRRGAERPVLVVEPAPDAPRGDAALAEEIAAHRAELTERVTPTAVLFRKAFPVDVRHNAKIHRETLKHWAEEQVG